MGLFKKKKDVQELELSEKHVGLRFALVIILLGIGLACIAFFLFSLLSEEDGWQSIDIEDKSFMSEGEIVLNYELGKGELSATKEKRAIQGVYGEALKKAYKLFDSYREYEGIANISYLNKHPNEETAVDPELYEAFELMAEFEDRSIYLAPMQAEYRNVFMCTDDVNAAMGDPYFNEEQREYVKKLMTFISDENAVRVELLGDNKIKLCVSEDYSAFATENGIENFLDMAWLTNAFVVDSVADALVARGYTRGYINSYDGYTRYLDAANNRYAINLHNKNGNTVYPAAVAECGNISALVQLRNYPINKSNARDFYAYSNGSFASRYVDVNDGYYKSSQSELLSYSSTESCAQIALTLREIFIADSFDENKIMQAKEKGIYSIWFADHVVYYNNSKLEIKDMYNYEGITYAKKCVE